MNVEQELCKAIAAVFQSALPDVEVRGNWIEDDAKGVDVYEGRKLTVSVGARKYDAYTSRIAEFAVTLDVSFAFSEDTTLADTVDAYEKIMSVLDDWHADINAVKRDLTLYDQLPTTNQPTTIFDPVGLRLDGGNGLVIEDDDKERLINQQFTVRGRISKP